MKSFFKYLFGLIGLALLVFISLLIYLALMDYKPEPLESVEQGGQSIESPVDSNLYLMSWNIGYGGLFASQDFFYDGGEFVRPTKKTYEANEKATQSFFSGFSHADFILLQEMDRHSKRSWWNDQVKEMHARLEGNFSYSFARNYDCKFVPAPYFGPYMGRVLGGLATFHKYTPSYAMRHDFPGSYSFPTNLAMLDRCFMVERFPAPGGKELVIINTHNSAYDDGSMKADEMAALKNFLTEEEETGNWIIVGGDWNQCPPGFDPLKFKKEEAEYSQTNIPADYMPGWTWAYDGETPTNRKVSAPYNPDTTFTTVIDFFLLSPNVELRNVHGIDMGFKYSDHQPVEIEVTLR